MSRAWRFLPTLAALVSFDPAFAQAPGMTYDCDKGANHFSNLVLPAPDGPFVVSGHVEVKHEPLTADAAPMARVSIGKVRTAPEQPPPVMVGFQAIALGVKALKPPPPSLDTAETIQFVDWKEQAGTLFANKGKRFGIASNNGGLDFSLTFSAGTVTGKVGGEEYRFTLAVPHPVVMLMCANEDVFSNLKIEKSASPQTAGSNSHL